MPETSDRYKKFLNSYDFFSNSISFRVQSSRALEKWKNVQSFQLNQLINGKFFFPHDRREILLLKYDLWSRWLYEIENMCIESLGTHTTDIITQEDIDLILMLAEKTSKKYFNIITKEHPERFNNDFSKIWLESHQIVNKYMMSKFTELKGESFNVMFISIVDILCEIMQYTLTEIHEINTLFCKNSIECDSCNTCEIGYHCPTPIIDAAKDKTPFIIIMPIEEKIYKKLGVYLVTEKLKIYKKYFSINEIYFKNYTDEKLSDKLIRHIEELGININFRKSI